MTSTRLIAYSPNGASLGPLPTPDGVSVGYPLNDVGALTLGYHPDAPRVDLLGQPVEIAVEVSWDQGLTWVEPKSSRFLYLRDGRDPIRTGDQFSVEAAAYVLRLKKALVGFTGLNAEGNREFVTQTPGAIMLVLWDEAKARGALAGMNATWTATQDSAGTPWPETLGQVAYEPGKDLLSILTEFAELGLVDFQTSGRDLQVYVAEHASGMAADRTLGALPVTLRYGRDLTEAPFRRTWEGLADTALVRGDNGSSVERTNAGALIPWGRQETYVTASGVDDVGTLSTIGDAALTLTANERTEHTFGLDFGAAPSLPFRDYAPGEWVYASVDGTSAPQRMRVRQVTLTQDANGGTSGNVVLNDRFLEADVLQNRKIASITQGATLGGTGTTPGSSTGQGPDILAPAQPTGLSATSASYLEADGRPRAQISLDWNDVTTNADGTVASDVDHYEVEARRVGFTQWQAVGNVTTSAWFNSPYDPGQTWEFKVRAVDTVFNRGAWSASASVTTVQDTTAPSVPSTPTLATRLGIVDVTWNGKTSGGANIEADTAYVEVHASTVTNFTPGPTTLKDTLLGAGTVPVSGMPYGAAYVRLVAVDQALNKSGPSAQASVTVKGLVDTDVIGQVLDGAKVITGTVGTVQIATDAITSVKIAPSAVDTSKIAANAVDATKIAAGAVDTTKIAANAVDSTKIAALAVDATKIAALAVDASKIATGAVTDTKVATGAITAAKVATGAIGAVALADGAVTGVKVATGAITAPALADGAVTGVKVATGAIGPVALADGAVTGVKVAAGAVDAAKIADGAVEGAKIATGAVTALKIAALAIESDKIAANAVVAGKVAADAIDANAIQANAITTAKISAGAVTAATIATDAITAAKISAGAITTAKIAAGAITANEVAANAITTLKIAAGAVTAGTIATDAITAVKIAAGAITTAKISAGAVTANEVATNAITAVKIASSAIESDKIAANAITAQKVAANAITATHLTLGDQTNLVADGNLNDPLFQNWSAGAHGLARTGPTGPSDPGFMSWTASTAGNAHIYNLPYVEAKPGDEFYLTAEVSTPAANTASLNVILAVHSYDAQKATITWPQLPAKALAPGAAWQVYEGIVTIGAGNTAFVRFDPFANSTVAGQVVRMRNMSVRRRNAGSLIVDGAITALKVAADAITADKIAASAITADKVAANAITTQALAAGAVTADTIAANAITAQKVQAGAIGADQIAANAITALKINAGAIESDKIAANAVTTQALAAGAVTAGTIAANAVTAQAIAALSISAGAIQANAVTAGKIAADAVTATTIAAGAITAGKIAANAVTAGTVAAGAVTAGTIATNAVTSGTVAANAITAGKIATDAVTAGTIAAGAVTAGKIAALAVTAGTIAANAVTADKVDAGAITAAKIALNSVDDSKITTITPGKVRTGVLQATERIVAGGLTGARTELNGLGFQAFDSGGVKTFEVLASSGAVYTAGTFTTKAGAGSGRVEISALSNPYQTGQTWASLAFYSNNAAWDPALLWAVYGTDPGPVNWGVLSIRGPRLGTRTPAAIDLRSEEQTNLTSIDLRVQTLSTEAKTHLFGDDGAGRVVFRQRYAGGLQGFSFQSPGQKRINFDFDSLGTSIIQSKQEDGTQSKLALDGSTIEFVPQGTGNMIVSPDAAGNPWFGRSNLVSGIRFNNSTETGSRAWNNNLIDHKAAAHTTGSDAAWKGDQEPLAESVAPWHVLESLAPKSWTWTGENAPRIGQRGLGFIAQEVQALIPEAVTGVAVSEGGEGLAIDLVPLVAVLWSAVQELEARVRKMDRTRPPEAFRRTT